MMYNLVKPPLDFNDNIYEFDIALENQVPLAGEIKFSVVNDQKFDSSIYVNFFKTINYEDNLLCATVNLTNNSLEEIASLFMSLYFKDLTFEQLLNDLFILKDRKRSRGFFFQKDETMGFIAIPLIEKESFIRVLESL